ncbi:type I toxin-antitoxin system SymE family toxin [Xanthomonas prunicola]|nr:type I toxin-antitoxin system SymE family toxin [Xanthomonas prunicola]UXA71569.1 type I toxin-antitoxin system SymE family toxin [Xanthomonas prunicola]
MRSCELLSNAATLLMSRPACRARALPAPTCAAVRRWVMYYPRSQQRVPALRLRGRWLEQLGFAIGSKLCVTVRDRALVITVIGEECMRRCKASR